MVTANKNLPDLEFQYDANRQRVCKIVKPHDAPGSGGALKNQSFWQYTYYMRDASGNVVAIYNRDFLTVNATTFTDEIKLQEQNIYGSSRLGITNVNQVVYQNNFTPTISGGLFQTMNYSTVLAPPTMLCLSSYPDANGNIIVVDCPTTYSRTLGNKRFELTNHLGNVLSIVSDRKLQQAGAGTTNVYSRIFDDGNLTGVTGVPTSAAISIVANQLNVSPQAASSGANFNFPTTTGINYTFEFDLDKGSVDASDGLTLAVYDNAGALATSYPLGAVASGHYSFSYLATSASANVKLYFTSGGNTPANTSLHFNHSFGVDNFLVTTINPSNLVVSKYMPEILETHDYYAFGMDMPGRNVTTSTPYLYGNNGQMREKEEFEGAYSADFWVYDSRLGRRWEADPISYEWQSPYVCFNNNPIAYSDALGLEGKPKPNEEGHIYECGHGEQEIFHNGGYVPYRGKSKGNSNLPNMQGRVLTIGGNFGQSKYSDAVGMRILKGFSPSQKQAARMNGMMNAMTSNEALGFGRREAKDAYMDPELQSLYMQGQIAGDIASIMASQAQMAAGGGMVAGGEGLAIAGAGVASTGVGAAVGAGMVIIGEGIAIVGEATVVHGQLVTLVASANLARTTVLLAATTYHDGNTAAAQSDGGGSGDGTKAKPVDPDLDKTMIEVVPQSLTKGKSWAGEYQNFKLKEIISKAKTGDFKAKQMWKLYRDRFRLLEKIKSKK